MKLKNSNGENPKNSNGDRTQKVKLLQNSNCDKCKKKNSTWDKTQIVTKLKL